MNYGRFLKISQIKEAAEMRNQLKGGSKMRKSLLLAVLLGFIGMCSGIAPSYAGEVDILLQKLVEKGVLSAGEAQEMTHATCVSAAAR